MAEEQIVRVEEKELHSLMKAKLMQAGLKEEHADEVATHLVFADLSGVHSHGAVRVDYYAERIAKGGITTEPSIHYEETGPSCGILHGDNGMGHYVALKGMEKAIDIAKETGIAIVGVSKMSHSGTMAYYLKKIADNNLIGISMCQSDPMVVPFGGAEVYFGTNPIGYSFPCEDRESVVFDMATSVQAWGKILDARAKNQSIPETWAVDAQGKPTTDPHNVHGLLPISGPKGYGLMMLIDVLSGVLLGLPHGKHVSSMYDKMEEGRDLGQLFIVFDPSQFGNMNTFKERIHDMVDELHEVKPADGFEQVYYPGELAYLNRQKYRRQGVPIAKSIYDYLVSDTVHFDQYGGKDPFAE